MELERDVGDEYVKCVQQRLRGVLGKGIFVIEIITHSTLLLSILNLVIYLNNLFSIKL